MERVRLAAAVSTLFFLTAIQAQNKVVFRITELPPYHQDEAIYLAGSFNNWNPASEQHRLQKSPEGTYSIVLDLPDGTYEYKFTQGSWETVETAGKGFSLQNRRMDVAGDSTISIIILDWADHFPAEKKSTVTPQVHIISQSFYIPQLNRFRRIWIYLPQHYGLSKKSYPVLYLHDGQNVFEDTTSFSGEWGVDEALDSLGRNIKESIVVAIDHGGENRLQEYAPYDFTVSSQTVNAEGALYLSFLVNTLQPYINKRYRTRKGHRHQFIGGSSMGGLISFYALLKYPNKFGGAAVFSPSFWTAPQLKNDIEKRGRKVKGKIYFYAGKEESESMVSDLLAVLEGMHKVSKAKMTTVIRTEGRHNEASWRQEFPLFTGGCLAGNEEVYSLRLPWIVG